MQLALVLPGENSSWRSQCRSVREAGGGNPSFTIDEIIGLEFGSSSGVDLVRPPDARSFGTGTRAEKLGEEGSFQTEAGGIPVQPACRVHNVSQVGPQVHTQGVSFPGTPEISQEDVAVLVKIRNAVEVTVLE